MSGPSPETGQDPAPILNCQESMSVSESVCPEPEEKILDDSQRLEKDLVEAFRELTPEHVDLLEVWVSWDSPLSQAVIDAGGKAFRMGLHNGFDLSTKSGFTKAAATLRRLRPRYVHVSPPRDPWTSQNNMNQRTEEARLKLEARRQHSRKILRHCLQLIQIQRQELNGQSGCRADCLSGHAGGEHPLRAPSRSLVSVRWLDCVGIRDFELMGVNSGLLTSTVFPFRSHGAGSVAWMTLDALLRRGVTMETRNMLPSMVLSLQRQQFIHLAFVKLLLGPFCNIKAVNFCVLLRGVWTVCLPLTLQKRETHCQDLLEGPREIKKL